MWNHLKTAAWDVVDVGKQALCSVFNVLVYSQLRQLYFNGPSFGQFGFWGGMDTFEICHTLSPLSSANFWRAHADECEQQLEFKFRGFLFTVQWTLYGYMLYRLHGMLSWLCWFMCCKRRERQTPQVQYVVLPSLPPQLAPSLSYHSSSALSSVVSDGSSGMSCT
jgi:hypothetical protein